VRSRLVALLGLMLAGAACQWLVTLDADGPTLTPREAGVVEAGLADPCGPVPPPPIDVPDGGPDAALDIVLAATYFGYDNVGREGILCAESSLDIDGLDSGPPDCTPLACQPAAAGKNSAACDGPWGADNAFEAILKDLSLALGQSKDTLTALAPTVAISRGVLNFLVELQDYNGTPNDDNVNVLVWTSSGITGLDLPTTLEYQQIVTLPEVWDGGDPSTEWTIDDRSVRSDGALIFPKITSTGYVKDGLFIVPHLGQLMLPPLVGSPIQVTDASMSGKLFLQDGRWRLIDGRIAARIENRRLLDIVGASKLTGAGQLCDPGSDLYAVLRSELCSSLDLPPDGGAADPTVTCGAMSGGFAIDSIETKITYQAGTVAGFKKVLTGPSRFHGKPPCADGGTVFCDDCTWAASRRCPPEPLQ
jgi:hypothetical protein